MQTVSDNFLTEVQRSHTVIVKAELYVAGTLNKILYPIDGSVDVDARRAIRRSATITLIDEDGTLNPNNPNSNLTPYGNEIRLYRGVKYLDDSEEYVPLGVFRITDVEVSYQGGGTKLVVNLEDRGRTIQYAKWSSPYSLAVSTNYKTIIQDAVTSRMAGLLFDLSDTIHSSPAGGAKVLGLDQSDPLSDILSIAESIGQEAFFDAVGTFTTNPIPALGNVTGVVTFAEDEGNGTLLSVSNSFSTDNIYNGVIAKGEGSQLLLPFESRVWDDDANSPFRRTGLLGERPFEWTSSLISTQAQVDEVASMLFSKFRGQTIKISTIPNPAIDVRDFVNVTSSTIGVDTSILVDTINIPLNTNGAMTISGRTRGY